MSGIAGEALSCLPTLIFCPNFLKLKTTTPAARERVAGRSVLAVQIALSGQHNAAGDQSFQVLPVAGLQAGSCRAAA
jgi:hypothetical protein